MAEKETKHTSYYAFFQLFMLSQKQWGEDNKEVAVTDITCDSIY